MRHFSKNRLRYLSFLLLFVSILLSLIFGELLLRFVVKVQIPKYPPQCYLPELYEEFRLYGYRLHPSRTATYSYPVNNPRKLTVVSNSDGFRSCRELDELDDRLRILIAGDSFVFGEGVEANERFTNILERIENEWRIDNIGMTGFGPDLMLRALEAVVLKSKPDIVVLCIYTDDFRRVSPWFAGGGFKVPRFKLVSRHLKSIPYPVPMIWDKLAIYQVIRKVWWHRFVEFDLNKAILDKYIESSNVNSFTPAIIFLPGRNDNSKDKKRRGWLRRYAEQSSIPFLDITIPIHAAGKNIFIEKNSHYNPHGHYIVATELHQFINNILYKDFLRGQKQKATDLPVNE